MGAAPLLKGITWDHPRAYECLLASSKLFSEVKGIDISWEKRSLQAFADISIQSLAQQYDLIVLDHPHVGQIAQSRCLLPLPEMKDSKTASLGGSLESYVWEGQQWAYPIDAACQMGVRRADLNKPFPKFWEQIFSEDAAQYALITPLLPVDAFDMMMTLVASCGEKKQGVMKETFCKTENALFALKILKRLYTLGPSEAYKWNPIDVLELLSQTDDFGGSPCLFGYINYAREGFRPHQLTYCDLPVFKDVGLRAGILGGAGLGVSALRSYSDEGIAFAQWVASEPVQSGVYLENEGQPAHLQTWLKKKNDSRYQGFLSGAFSTMETAWTRPREEWFLGFVDEVCEIFPDLFLKDQSEQHFLNRLNQIYRHYNTIQHDNTTR